ncbi:hypothetical protein Tco_1087304 [Tanacetum coccineum]
MDLEIEKEKKKPAETQEIETEQIEKDTIGKRKKSLPRKRTRSSIKKQKVELDDEKEDLKGYLDIVPREDVAVDVDSLSTNKSTTCEQLLRVNESLDQACGYLSKDRSEELSLCARDMIEVLCVLEIWIDRCIGLGIDNSEVWHSNGVRLVGTAQAKGGELAYERMDSF